MFHRKYALFLLLTLTAACLATGCKKGGHEKIDLSSTHTSAAETMAPETSAPQTTEAAAADSPTTSVTIDAAVENAANSNSTLSPTKGSGSVSNVKSIKATVNAYTSGKITVQYPSVENLDDTGKAASINQLLKDNALSIITAYGMDGSKDSLDIKCRVLSADRNRITVTYSGTGTAQGSASPANYFYSNTVDVRKASNISLTDIADPATLARYVLSGDCVLPNASQQVKDGLAKLNPQRGEDYYTSLFTGADFPIDKDFPLSFSYEQQGDIYFTIPVPHELGDYVLAVFTPENK